MAYTKLKMENPKTGELREAPIGFSWTVLLFGPFPALFRGDYKNFFIMLLLAAVTSGISGLYYMFTYNGIYIKTLIEKGFKAIPAEGQVMKDICLKTGVDIPILKGNNVNGRGVNYTNFE